MTVTIKNLGAIKDATIELGGLTMFVGPNGTGKSYLAKVLYGLQRHETITGSFFKNADRFYQMVFGKSLSTFQDAFSDLQQLKPVDLRKILSDLANLHAELFKEQLADFFNDDSNIFSDTLIFYSNIPELSDDKLRNIIDLAIEQVNSWLNAQASTTLLTPRNDISPESVPFALLWHLFWGVGGGLADYFPAARSNFMLTYKEIYRARADESVGLENVSDKLLLASKGVQTRKAGKLIRFDKPTEDFLGRLYDLDVSTNSSLSKIGVNLQKRLYNNDRIVIEQPEGGSLLDFKFHINSDLASGKIRLHLASSMVTETSPLLLGFWHWVQPNSLVIIDEPESHLHPEAQRSLISGLAEAVNQGLQLILITHSPYILSCVNNLIKFSNLIKNFPEDEEVSQLKTEYPDLIAIDKPVHAYHFGRDGLVKDILLESGLIDEAEFTEPFDRINDLYQTMRDIEWEHRK
ncbi:AAA family ATPase [Methylomonas sp. HW2-6]|uniref:AAA family ATPase n=1 Tax=Methylomonas TaxID=416 RepID=UPI00112D1D2E|nr:AAA family ATPase [Methylomonas koyamae]TPQ26912.1 hypothetical protein C2U68_09490 [Methylomonas koyamae]